MAKEDRPSQSSAILDGQHDKGACVVTSLNEAMLIRPLAIEKDRIVEILSSPSLAPGDPMHGIFTETPFDIVREGADVIHTSHGVKEGDEPISANVKRENVGSILKPMSSAGSTNEAAKVLGIADTPPSTAIGSNQGASFAPMSLEGNPWLAVESTFQNNTTEDVYREPARMFAKSILSNAVKTITSSNLEVVLSYFGITKIALRNAWEAGLDTSMVESTFGAIFEIATKYSEALKVNSHELLEKELRASRVTYQTRLDEVLTAYEAAYIKKKTLFNNLSDYKMQREKILSKIFSAETVLRRLKEDLARVDTSVQKLTYQEESTSRTLASLTDEQKSIEEKIIHIDDELAANEVQVEVKTLSLEDLQSQFAQQLEKLRSLQGSSEIGGKCGKGVFETLGNGGNVIEEQLQELDLQQDSKALGNVLKQCKKKPEVLENEVQSLQESLRNMEKQLNKLKSSCSCHARSSRKMSSNSESLDLKAECTAEDLAGLEVNGKSPILDTTGCKPSIPSVTPCDLQVLDQEGSCVLTPYMDRNIFSDAMENDRSQLLLGSQELPASDVERSNRCQALCANGEKKHLNVEKARRKLLTASTMPVKEVGAFDMEDDNPWGGNTTQCGEGGNNPQVRGWVIADYGSVINFGIQAGLRSRVNLGLQVGPGSNGNSGLKAGGRRNANLFIQVSGGSNVQVESHYNDGTRSCAVSPSPIDCFTKSLTSPIFYFILLLLFFCYWRVPDPLGWTNPSGHRGKLGKLPSSPSVVVQFRTDNLREQTVVLGQLSYPLGLTSPNLGIECWPGPQGGSWIPRQPGIQRPPWGSGQHSVPKFGPNSMSYCFYSTSTDPDGEPEPPGVCWIPAGPGVC